MKGLLNWSLLYLAIFVAIFSVLYGTAPSFVRINKGTTDEQVCVGLTVIYGIALSVFICGGIYGGMYVWGDTSKGYSVGYSAEETPAPSKRTVTVKRSVPHSVMFGGSLQSR